MLHNNRNITRCCNNKHFVIKCSCCVVQHHEARRGQTNGLGVTKYAFICSPFREKAHRPKRGRILGKLEKCCRHYIMDHGECRGENFCNGHLNTSSCGRHIEHTHKHTHRNRTEQWQTVTHHNDLTCILFSLEFPFQKVLSHTHSAIRAVFQLGDSLSSIPAHLGRWVMLGPAEWVAERWWMWQFMERMYLHFPGDCRMWEDNNLWKRGIESGVSM